ncbi:hypothetical protein ACFY78_42340 [Streptomyces olindensis]|uniref:hypothetical protein n=1 Tax=Streptomyces olindensis TaxID=358823 RepID=UPI003697AC17
MDTLYLFLACVGGHLLHAYYAPFAASIIPGWSAHFGNWWDLGKRAGLALILGLITLPLLVAYDVATGTLRYVIAAIFGWSIRGLIVPAVACTCRSCPA